MRFGQDWVEVSFGLFFIPCSSVFISFSGRRGGEGWAAIQLEHADAVS